MSTSRCIPAFTRAHCWCSSFSDSSSIREDPREARAFAQGSPISSRSPSPLCVSYFHEMLRERLRDSHFSPSPLLVVLPVGVTKAPLTLPTAFMSVSRPPYLSSLCSAAPDSWDVRLSQCCHWVPYSGPASRCICRISASNTTGSAIILINFLWSCGNQSMYEAHICYTIHYTEKTQVLHM